MDAWTVAGIGAVIAGVSLVFAISATLAARAALTRATAVAAANRAQIEKANDAAQVARQEAFVAINRLTDIEKKLLESQTELRATVQRAQQLDQRLAEAEDKLREVTEGIGPPRIPSGRSVARLNELRETLRAQAAESAEGEQTP